MHFWIDKRSQGCVRFNGGHIIRPYIAGFRRGASYSGVYPKLMVTPVHRFQSIESVANAGRRNQNRGPGYYHARFIERTRGEQIDVPSNGEIHPCPVIEENLTQGNALNRSNDVLSHSSSALPRETSSTAKIKCGVWAFFAIITFFIALAKFYFHGANMGMEALAFCALLVFILLVGGLVSLYEAVTSCPLHGQNSAQVSNEQNEIHEESSQVHVPNDVPVLVNPAEMPPPPYHIAIMLPTQDVNESLQIIRRDSPPPTYEKAVT
ncbi:uncharacterized protein [Onthophagus taurus]|uniref:uncharacterized protein n=1 Tax=Onthophagus taurus TaxID=166361 RepID=UPI000C20DAEF|nr:uncharacterized protein LOC111426095 [Onthophagus taurus]